jgi:uncharacterized protein (TIGR03435 family)
MAILATLPLQATAQPRFEVASVRLNDSGSTSMKLPPPTGGRFTATNIPLKVLISYAYGVQGFEISGGPGWMSTDRYDIAAKTDAAVLDMNGYKSMLQALLVDRFKLGVHRETKDVPIFALVPAKSGPKLTPADASGCVAMGPNAPPPPPRAPSDPAPTACGTFFTGPNTLDGKSMSMSGLANTLSIMVGRPVIDKTGIPGIFDIHMEFAPGGTNLPAQSTDPDSSGLPSIFTAIQQQLGLRLESQKGPGQVLVIDHVEKPDAN